MFVDPREWAEKLPEKFPGVEAVPDAQVVTIMVPPDELLPVAEELAAGGFNMLMDLTAADWPDYFEVVYFLWSVPGTHQLWLKVRLPKDRPDVPSVSAIWPAALCMEREAYDLMGISFTGHPDLRRILCPDDFVGHPLRKDLELKEATRQWD